MATETDRLLTFYKAGDIHHFPRPAFVPNEEIRQELITAVESKSWNEMLIFQQTSEEILNATLDMDTEEVAD